MSNEHRCYWLDDEHTQFLYWIHHANGTWEKMILTLDKDAPWEVLNEIAQSYREEILNDRYQEELIDYSFVLKRARYEKRNRGLSDDGAYSDPYEELTDPLDGIFEKLFPEAEAKESELKAKFRDALSKLLPQQNELLYKYYLEKKTIQAICDEENELNGTHITHQAITNRLDKIFRRISKLIPELGMPCPRRKPPKKK